MSNFIIKSVSLPQLLADYVDKNPPLSLSKLLQSKIIEVMNNQRHFQEHIKRLEIRNELFEKKLWEANETIEKMKGGKQ